MKLITGKELKNALINAHACLNNEKAKIDALNVFPVPDGDTGTNMLLTFTSGIEAVMKTNEDHVGLVMKSFSRGLLMGARGNSGVILSQIFRGMSRVFESKETINGHDIIEGLIDARETAYKAVMNPVEGTILTIISDMAKDVTKYRESDDIRNILSLAIEAGEKSLEATPTLLPVLKEAGVVDSGGYGLIVIFNGIYDYFNGIITETKDDYKVFDNAEVLNESTEFGYCTEFIFELDEVRSKQNKFSEEKLKQQLNKIGDSLVVVHDDDIVKIHVHTLVPGEAINIGQMYGEFIKLKIENMTLQHEEIIRNHQNTDTRSGYAIIAVSSGTGISDLFTSNGASYIIDGGQTMNPSTSDFMSTITESNAKNIIILPNNSNIIMAAMQAKELAEEKFDMSVEVIPTKSVIQGLASLSFFNDEADIQTNKDSMIEAYDELKYGELTYAVRDTTMNDIKIKKGEYISIFEKNIISSNKNKIESLLHLIDKMIDEESSVITLIHGKDVTDNEMKKVEKKLLAKFENYDIEIFNGNQDVYSFLVGIE